MSVAASRWRLSPFARAPGFADWLILTAIVVVAVAAAFPLAWMALTSLMTPAETMRTPPVWIPATPSLDAYAKVADVIQAGRSFLNSAIIATTTTLGILITSLLAGFAFAKYQFRGRNVIFALVVATMFLPPIVTLIPLYRLVGYLRICYNRGAMNTNLVMAGAALAVLPPLILFAFLQRFFVDSIVSAG